MTVIAIVQATFPDLEEASRIGAALVEERLAACANVVAPCLSVYRWQESVDTAHEAIAQFKTLPERAAAAAERIAELHSYDLPAIEWWTAATNDAGYRWVCDSLAGVRV